MIISISLQLYKHKQRRIFIICSLLLFIQFNTACSQKNGEVADTSNKFPSLDVYRAGVADSLKFLLPILDSVYQSDQKYRAGTGFNYGGKIAQEKSVNNLHIHKKELRFIDSMNALTITHILDKYGWLGPKDIGYFGNLTLFNVIQHADSATQEKYLPLLKKAVTEKKALSSHVALLEDRLSFKKIGRQIYGTQLIYDAKKKRHYIIPLVDPDNLMERRKSIGMDSVSYQSYLSQFQLKWNIDVYKKELPVIEKLLSANKNHL